VADTECFAGDGVDDSSVGAAVVGEHAFDVDAVASVKGESAVQESGGCCCFLVGEDLGVGKPAVVVDSDVDVLVPDGASALYRRGRSSGRCSGDARCR
jgi:hypothetical protein